MAIPMDKSKTTGHINNRNRHLIRDFCERATNTGGILFVSGSRGTGKSWLVDDALNKRSIDNKPTFWNQLFGNVSNSERLSRTREPNHVTRHIIKVDVDPYFPYSHTDSNTTSDEKDFSTALISNIVFGLTSVIDCRYSQRKHGKTMRAKLGFKDYWFSNNALLWRKNNYISKIALFVLPCFLLLLITWVHFFVPNIMGNYFPHIIVSTTLSPLISWIYFRWCDWRSLEKMSNKLYALVHAELLNEKKDKSAGRKQNNLWITLALVFLFILLCIGLSNDIEVLINALESQLKVLSDPVKVLLGGSLAASIVWTSSQRSQQHIEYGGKNPVWMITLLKRYLFLCHRCGIEPILVFDELNKLEDIDEWWKKRSQKTNSSDKSSTEQDGNSLDESNLNNSPNKLDQFLVTVAGLKASLGAEFLWILIGGPNVYSRLQQDRHDQPNGALGLLATTIQQEVLVAPISYPDTKQLINETDSTRSNENKIKTLWRVFYSYLSKSMGTDTTQFDDKTNKTKDKRIKTLWLRSYANPSTIIRNHEKEHYDYHKKTKALANRLIKIWPAKKQLDYIDFTTDKIWLDKIEEEWVQSWIHTGMLVFANDLLKKPIRYADMRNQLYKHWPDTLESASDIVIHPEIIALQSEDTRLLMALGKQILFAYLTDKGHLSNPQDDESKKEYVEFINKPEKDTNSSAAGNPELTN